ncbi:MAG: class I SAM-dependent methyltransferase [Hoeflea sp.]|uniref:class I SAM-dependent methyltransferase n=1 Tax=Hoeflea sp. TaxID=1940281 RepID=UPI00329926DA
MSGFQTETFRQGEADKWFERNAAALQEASQDVVCTSVLRLGIKPSRILEIGSANGWRLAWFRQKMGATCSGIDPSSKAIEEGTNRFPGLDLKVGTADDLPFKDASFDMVILGFCMYLVDPSLHFRVVSEIDRVLADGGHVVIFDFQSPFPYHNPYHHFEGLKAHKMEYARLFLSHPGYGLLHRELKQHGPDFMDADRREGVDIISKNMAQAFPLNPAQR